MSLGWLRVIPLQLKLAAVAVCGTNVEITLELHESVVAAGTDGHILPDLNVAKEVDSLFSKCLKVFLL